ncbi:hypothetical protein TKK_0014696 [Trichogramma kaykai]
MPNENCSYKSCTNNKKKNKELSFHRFPKQSDLFQDWCKRIGKQEFIDLPKNIIANKRVCSVHFPDSAFINRGAGKKGLIDSAKPFSINNKCGEDIDNGFSENCPSVENLSLQSIGQEDSVIEESVSMIEGNDSEIERNNSIIEADSVINRADITEEVPVNVTENHTIARQKKVLCAAKKCILSLAKANKKLKSRNQLLQQKVRRLQQMCRRSLKRAKDRKIKKCEIIEAAAEHCNKNFMILLNMQLNHEDRKLEWSATEKYFALDLYYRSPKLYKHMRNGLKFALPCLTVMKKWVNEINLAPGANEDLFKLLTVKSESMNQYEKQCVMMWDEMSIRSCLEYNEKDDYIEGFEDLGEYGRTNAIATQVLVIMLSGLQSNWKQAIFFKFSKGSVSTETLKKIIIDMLDKIENTGLQVKMMVCDQGTANQKLIANFEISEARPYILKFGRKIFFNFDAPHLFKCWRNNMMDNDFLIGDNQVSWECIKELRDLERDKPCRAAPKLSDRHLNPNNFQKMNVKLAVQIFSASVSRAMITGYHCGDLKHPHCEATAAFLWSMNKLFDHINARHANDANPDRRGLSQKNPAVENSLRNFIPWLENIAVVSKPSPPCFRNLILTIQGILGLWEEKKREGQFYLLTGKLNQDPLENYFAFMRYLSGCNTHPTAMKFRYNHQHGTIMSLLFPPPGANCKPDDCINLLSTLSEIKLQKNADNIDQKETDDYVDKKLNAWLINDYAYAEVEDSPSPKTDLGDQNQPTLLRCSMKYVAGYLAHKCLIKFHCESCRSTLIRENQNLEANEDLLIFWKAYNVPQKELGNLKVKEIENVNKLSDDELKQLCKEIYKNYHKSSLESLKKFGLSYENVINEDIKIFSIIKLDVSTAALNDLNMNDSHSEPNVADSDEGIENESLLSHEINRTGELHLIPESDEDVQNESILLQQSETRPKSTTIEVSKNIAFQSLILQEIQNKQDEELSKYNQIDKSKKKLSIIEISFWSTLSRRTFDFCLIDDLANFATVDQYLGITTHKINVEVVQYFKSIPNFQTELNKILNLFMQDQKGLSDTAVSLKNYLMKYIQDQYVNEKKLVDKLKSYLQLLNPDGALSIHVCRQYSRDDHLGAMICTNKFQIKGTIFRVLSTPVLPIKLNEEKILKDNNKDFSIFCTASNKYKLWLGPGAYVNHSCNPNMKLYNLIQNGKLCFQAIRDINVGEEINWCYSKNFFNNEECECLSCRSTESKDNEFEINQQETCITDNKVGGDKMLFIYNEANDSNTSSELSFINLNELEINTFFK